MIDLSTISVCPEFTVAAVHRLLSYFETESIYHPEWGEGMLFDYGRLQWHEEYGVGVPLIDDEHRKLFALLRELHDALTGRCDEPEVRTFARDMVEYIARHLAEEEEEMQRVSFPDLPIHQQEHERFLQKIRLFGAAIEAGEGPLKTLCLEMIATLADWFSHHFVRMDKEVVPYLRNR